MTHYNITPLAFYTDLNDQNHRLSYAENRSFALFSPAQSFLPFQIISNNKATNITSISLFDFNDNVVTPPQNLTNYFQSNISFITKPDYNVLVYNSANSLSSDLQEGCYYLRIVTNRETFYSELFMSKKNLRARDTVGIFYWDENEFDFQTVPGILYYAPDQSYRNAVYIETELAKPEYVIDEVIEDRNGFKFFEKQLVKKTYRFSFLAPEFLCDALSLVPLHDFINILHDGKVFRVYDILFTPEWLEDGFYAKVEVEFSTDAIFKKLNAASAYQKDTGFSYDVLNRHSFIKA